MGQLSDDIGELVLAAGVEEPCQGEGDQLQNEGHLEVDLDLLVGEDLDALGEVVAHVGFADHVPPLFAALDGLLQHLHVYPFELLLKVFVLIIGISIVNWHYNLLLLLQVNVQQLLDFKDLFNVDLDVGRPLRVGMRLRLVLQGVRPV